MIAAIALITVVAICVAAAWFGMPSPTTKPTTEPGPHDEPATPYTIDLAEKAMHEHGLCTSTACGAKKAAMAALHAYDQRTGNTRVWGWR